MRTLLLLLLVPLCLFFLAKCCGMPKIEAHIKKDMTALLASNPAYSDLSFDVSGQNVTVTGDLPNRSNLRSDLLAKVGALTFIGGITHQFTDKAAANNTNGDAEGLEQIANLSIDKTADTLTIEGVAANPKELNALQSYVTEGQDLTTSLSIAKLPDWWTLSNVSEKMTALPQYFNHVRIKFLDSTLTIDGELKASAESPIQSLISNLPKGIRIDANIAQAKPDKVAVACQEKIDGIVENITVFFKVGSDALSEPAKQQLNKAKVAMDECADYSFRVEGHTDSTGSVETNRILSQARATQVVKYLTGQGISAERLLAVGFGPARPVASNETDEGRQANRRIQIIIK